MFRKKQKNIEEGIETKIKLLNQIGLKNYFIGELEKENKSLKQQLKVQQSKKFRR